jgi:hypothetical protein
LDSDNRYKEGRVAEEVIKAEPLNFTKYTGWYGAAAAGVGGALVPILNQFADVSDTVLVGILAVVGASFIATSIAAAADVLARAYATSGPGAKGAEGTVGAASIHLALPAPIDVIADNQAFVAFAVRLDKDGKVADYLIGKSGDDLDWRSVEAVTIG